MFLVTRRHAVRLIAAAGAAAATLAFSRRARAEGFLKGAWLVRCANGHEEQVENAREHTCTHPRCGLKSVDDGAASVVCPAGHGSVVTGVTESHTCSYRLSNGELCGQECRLS